MSSDTEVDAVKVSMTDEDFYTDCNLDWSFLNLSQKMVKVLEEDYNLVSKKRFRKPVQFLKGPNVTKPSTSFVQACKKNQKPSPSVHVEPILTLTEEISNAMEDWSFNIFHINEMTKGNAILEVTHQIFKRLELLSRFDIDPITFDEFVFQVARHYKRIPFHNTCHATDVLQTVNCIIMNTGFITIMSELEIFCILITALVHDIEHTGTNNNFHMNSGSDMAKLYTVSVLENHHIRVGLRLLWKYGLLDGLTEKEVKEFKIMMCSMILCTDMVNHFQLITNMKSLLESPVRCTSRIRTQRIMMLVLHAADISNPAKPWDLHKIWVALLCEEFFRQGEKEKGLNLPVSPNCDKLTANIATLQMGFIETFLKETFELMDKLMENDINEGGGMYTFYSPWSVCIKCNTSMWKGQWRSLKYEFINKLFEETADPRKSVAVKHKMSRNSDELPRTPVKSFNFKQLHLHSVTRNRRKSKWRKCLDCQDCCSSWSGSELSVSDDWSSITNG